MGVSPFKYFIKIEVILISSSFNATNLNAF